MNRNHDGRVTLTKGYLTQLAERYYYDMCESRVRGDAGAVEFSCGQFDTILSLLQEFEEK